MKFSAKALSVTGFFLLSVFSVSVFAQINSPVQPAAPISPAEGRKLGAELVGRLLRLGPAESSSQRLLVKVTDRDDKEKEVPVVFSVFVTPTNFVNIYETTPKSGKGARLAIVHTDDRPNEYLWSEPLAAVPRRLKPDELMQPFAGSDFWVADLGLEFLHWPQQRILKKQMRRNLFCEVLESSRPNPPPGGYSKVVSWVAANRPDDIVIVHADAYDANGDLLKQFAPRKLRKVDGAWELAEMEIRNRQTRSSTVIEFEPDSK